MHLYNMSPLKLMFLQLFRWVRTLKSGIDKIPSVVSD